MRAAGLRTADRAIGKPPQTVARRGPPALADGTATFSALARRRPRASRGPAEGAGDRGRLEQTRGSGHGGHRSTRVYSCRYLSDPGVYEEAVDQRAGAVAVCCEDKAHRACFFDLAGDL